jgi:hypothetical protein
MRCCGLVPGGIRKEITAGQVARVLERVTPAGAVAEARCELAAEFPDGIRRLDAQLRETKKKLAAAVKASGTTVTKVFGAGAAGRGERCQPAGVGYALTLAGRNSGAERVLLIGGAGLTVMLSWTVMNTVYTLRYADLHFRTKPGGIAFGDQDGQQRPSYRDFAYVAFTIGMT